MSRILVLGATGTVGRPLTARLAQQGHAVRAATRVVEAYNGLGTPTALDLLDPSSWASALDGVERVFMLAPPGHADQYALLATFVDALPASVERVVLMTAQGVEVDDTIPFRLLELHLAASGIDHAVLRPSWFAQNFHTFWGHGVRHADTLALPAAEARVGFIDARDIAASAAAALTRDDLPSGKAWVLTGPAALTHAEAAVVLSEATGRTIRYQPIDDAAFRAQLAPSGLPTDYIEVLVGLFAAVRAGAASVVHDSVQRLTGEAPRPLEVYARDHAEALTRTSGSGTGRRSGG